MATKSLDTEFLDNFIGCSFCHKKITIQSNPQLVSCLHSVCFKCVTDKKSYCWKCQTPVKVMGDNSALTTVLKKRAGADPVPEELAITAYDKSQFGELADKVDKVIDDVQEKLKQLAELKIKLKTRAILESARAQESIQKQIEESRDRTLWDLRKDVQRKKKKLDKGIESNEKECKLLGKRAAIGREEVKNGSYILQCPGFIPFLRRSNLISLCNTSSMPLIKYDPKLDLRFGMLMSISFMDAYKRLAKIIPEEVIQNCYCKRLKISVSNFKPFINHLKNIDSNVLPSPPVISEPCFAFSDFTGEECFDMTCTLLSLKQKVRSSEKDQVTHLIVRNPVASLEIIQIIFSGGWMLKSTFISNAKDLNSLPEEYGHEWTTLKLRDLVFNPRICREAISRRGKPFWKLVVVVCTSNPRYSDMFRAGGADTVETTFTHVVTTVDAVVRSGKNRNHIIVVYDRADEATTRKVSRILKVQLHTIDKIIDLSMRGWFDRFNPFFAVRHTFRPN